MSLVALDGTPLVQIGAPNRLGVLPMAALGTTVVDAANEACIMIGRIFTEDGGSHTIDTTGSSSLGFRCGTVSASWNVGTIVLVGLGTVDTGAGPAGRATAVANVITFEVNGQYVGGAAPTTAAWNEVVPVAGTKTIANGDLVAFSVQMTVQGGTDSVQVASIGSPGAGAAAFPFVTNYTGGTYSNASRLPGLVITFSDGKLGFFAGGYVASVGTTTQTWNNSSSPNEYGNYFLMPVPVKVYGLIACCSMGGDADFVLYSDPLGTPVAEKTVSFDLNVLGAATASDAAVALFSSPYTTTASQPLAGIIKPTSATNISSPYMTLNASAHQKAHQLGTNGYAVNRASGAFAAQNSNKDRFTIGLLVGAFDNGAGGGSGGFPVLGGPFT